MFSCNAVSLSKRKGDKNSHSAWRICQQSISFWNYGKGGLLRFLVSSLSTVFFNLSKYDLSCWRSSPGKNGDKVKIMVLTKVNCVVRCQSYWEFGGNLW
jgi:hypothetical protein